MNAVNTVTVYNFLVSGGAEDRTTVAPFKASRELIRSSYRGEILEGTDEEVDVGALDAEGRYRRIATGWGELAG